MLNKCKYLAIIAAYVAVSGCVTTSKHLAPISGYPDTFHESVNFDTKVNFNEYSTFAFVEDSSTSTNDLGGIKGSTIRFIIADALEKAGYIEVKPGEKPDMVVAFNGRVTRDSKVLQGGVSYLPVYKPGEVYTYSGNTTINSYGTYGGGLTTANTMGTISAPGQWTVQEYKQPDRVEISYYGQLNVAFFDAQTKSQVGYISSQSKLTNPMPEIGLQYLTSSVYRVKRNEVQLKVIGEKQRWKGVAGFVVSPRNFGDGALYPTIMFLQPEGAAVKSGLQLNDVIVAINNIPTRDKTTKSILEEVGSNPGETVDFVVWRGGKENVVIQVRLQ